MNRRRPRVGPRLLEISEAGVVKLMATPSAARGLPAGSDGTWFPEDDQQSATVGQHSPLDLPEIDLKEHTQNEFGGGHVVPE